MDRSLAMTSNDGLVETPESYQETAPYQETAYQASASKCPIDHTAMAAACPAGFSGNRPPVQRSRADVFMRRLLRINERPAGVTTASAYSAFQKSMLISALRCTLTYVILPFVVPAVGFAKGVGPVIGITIGVVAMVCDVFAIRRFFAVDHRWRWHFTAVVLCVMTLLTVLLVQDVLHILN